MVIHTRCINNIMGESFPSPAVTAIPSGTIPVIRAEPLRKVLGYNRGVGGGLAVGLQSRFALGLWLVKYWAVHKGCKQTLPAF